MRLWARVCFVEEENVSLYPVRFHVGTVHYYIPQGHAFDPFEIFLREHTENIIIIIITICAVGQNVSYRQRWAQQYYYIIRLYHSLVFIVFKPEPIGFSDPDELVQYDGGEQFPGTVFRL